MKQKFLPSFSGLVKDYTRRIIPEDKNADGLNIIYLDGKVSVRPGYQIMLAGLPLDGAITNITEFQLLSSNETFLVVCTITGVYVYDNSFRVFRPLMSYNEGLIGRYELNGEGDMEVSFYNGANFSGLDVSNNELRLTQYATTRSMIIDEVVDYNTIKLVQPFVWRQFWILDGSYVGVNRLIIGVDQDTSIIPYIPSGMTDLPMIQFYSDTELPSGLIEGVQYRAWLVGYQGWVDLYNNAEMTRTITANGTNIVSCPNVAAIEAAGLEWVKMTAGGTHDIYRIMSYNSGANQLTLWTTVAAGSYSAIVGYARITLTEQTYNPMQVGHFVSTSRYDNDLTQMIPYSISINFGGDYDRFHDTAIAYDPAIDDKILLVTNGVEYIQKWTGSGLLSRLGQRWFSGQLVNGSDTLINCTELNAIRITVNGVGMGVSGHAGIPSGAYIIEVNLLAQTVRISAPCTATTASPVQLLAKTYPDYPSRALYIDFFGSVGFEHIITANLVEDGENFSQSLDFSNAGEVDIWNSLWYDLIDSNDPIVGVKRFQDRLLIYKEKSISIAYPTPTGGSSLPFDITQNKTDVGTPSGRTVCDFGEFHIFFGWDNIYLFNGISPIPIGNDIIADLLRNVNRIRLNRSFAFALKSSSLYVLLVPTGQETEFCNRAYVYNYRDQAWTIWQFAHEMCTYGSYHKTYPVTYDSLLIPVIKVGCQTTLNSSVVTIPDIEELDTLMCVEGTGIAADTNILSIQDRTHIVLDTDATATGTVTLYFYKSINNMTMGCNELIIYEDNETHLLGDINGNIYEINERYFADSEQDIYAFFETRDYALAPNAPKQTVKLVETIIGICNERLGAFRISASVDFGNNWTAPFDIDVDEGTDYIENIVNWIERGRQVRFKIENIDGSYFSIESLNIGFNDSGLIKTNY